LKKTGKAKTKSKRAPTKKALTDASTILIPLDVGGTSQIVSLNIPNVIKYNPTAMISD